MGYAAPSGTYPDDDCHDDARGGEPGVHSLADSPPWSAATTASPSPTSTAPAARRCPRAVVEAMTDYLLHHNANTHWAYPDQPRDRRGHRRRRAQALADFLGRLARRGRLRRQHDDADVPPRPGARPAAGARATRSWSPSSTTTPTSTPGARWSGSGASPSGSPGSSRRAGQLDDGATCGGDRRRGPGSLAIGAASNALGTINDVRRRARDWPTPRGPASSSTPSTTRRTRSSMSGRWAATSWPARPTSSTARTSACCTAGDDLLDALDVPKLEPAPTTRPSGWRPARRTTRASSARRRRSTSSPRSPTGADRRARLQARLRGAARAGPGAGRAAVGGPARDRGRDALRASARRAAHPDRRLQPSRGCRPAEVARRWPSGACSSRTATSTPPRWSRGWAAPRTASCARAAPATRRRTRSRLARRRSRARVRGLSHAVRQQALGHRLRDNSCSPPPP